VVKWNTILDAVTIVVVVSHATERARAPLSALPALPFLSLSFEGREGK